MTIVLDKFFFMKRIILFLCVLVFSIFSNTNNLLAKEFDNNIKENIYNEIEEIKNNYIKINYDGKSAIINFKNVISEEEIHSTLVSMIKEIK